jgi:pinin/SDK/memA/ protein conserved region
MADGPAYVNSHITDSNANASFRPIASAVILPDPEPSKSPRSKRRQPSPSDSTSKRPRFSHDGSVGSPTTLRESPQPIDPSKDAPPETTKDPISERRRKSSVQEERKRGQRLFGGLLSTLSQSTPNGQQKRRLEIEKRQQEKAKQQKVEDEIRRKEQRAKLDVIRKAEQVKFNEESVSNV